MILDDPGLGMLLGVALIIAVMCCFPRLRAGLAAAVWPGPGEADSRDRD